MKKLMFYVLAFIVLTNLQFAKAQGKLTEGKATFIFTYPDEEGINDQLLSVREVKGLTVYFKNGKSRAEYQDINKTVVIVDPKTKEKIDFHDKLAIKMTWEEAQKNLEQVFGNYNVKLTAETKYLAGYQCKKAIVTYEVWKKPNRTMEVWFTDELAASNVRDSFKGIDGFIMESSYVNILYPNEEGVDFKETMTCIKVEKVNVSDSLFKIPADYHVTTMEEMKKNMHIDFH